VEGICGIGVAETAVVDGSVLIDLVGEATDELEPDGADEIIAADELVGAGPAAPCVPVLQAPRLAVTMSARQAANQ
jgi:hypothetical protein